jgi:transcriptional regulator with XRE-family HTH domain
MKVMIYGYYSGVKRQDNSTMGQVMDSQKNGFGERVREAIQLKHKNLKQFSEESGVPYATIRGYISEAQKPGFDALSSIVKTTGVSGHWLLTGEGNMLGSGENDLHHEAVSTAIRIIQLHQINRLRIDRSFVLFSPDLFVKMVVKICTEDNNEVAKVERDIAMMMESFAERESK